MSGRVASGAVETVRVDLGPRSYPIVIGAGLLDAAGARIAALLPGRKVAVVTDATVARLHLPALEASLDAAGLEHLALTVPPGEASKSFAAFEDLCERLLAARVERSTVIAALGGGVVGDLAGFAAAVLLRGLDYVQLPTTLLAQVDSSVGGKTAIDAKAGKNLVGAFHQPRLVLADIAALETLPPRELKAGYAEIVKYGLIGDPDFFAWCEANGAALLAGDRGLRKHAVAAACRAKAAVVARDEREAGERALLNLGHTFAHALERAAGFGEALLHGEAVAAGMVMAFDLSAALGLCPTGDAARLRAHFLATGLPVDLAGLDLGGAPPSPEALLGFMASDKKVAQGRIRFVLARGIGKAFVADDVDPAAVRALLARAA